MAEVNLRSWPEISQASDDLQLNSIAAKLEHILARFARLESRLVEHERRVAATLPPLQPEPDPPDWQQPYMPYNWGAHADPPNGLPQNYVQPVPDQQVPTYGLVSAYDPELYRHQFDPYPAPPFDRMPQVIPAYQPTLAQQLELLGWQYQNSNPHIPQPPYGQSAYQNVGYPPVPTNMSYDQPHITEYQNLCNVDDNCIDGIGVDLDHRYGSGNEHSSSHASQAEEGDADAEIYEKFKIAEEGKVLDDDPAPPAAISLPCCPGILVTDVVLADDIRHNIGIHSKVLMQDKIWNDQTKFEDIFDVDYFIMYLKIETSGYYNWTEQSFAFDPGGDTRCSSFLIGFHLEDKVDFNRGGVDTCISI